MFKKKLRMSNVFEQKVERWLTFLGVLIKERIQKVIKSGLFCVNLNKQRIQFCPKNRHIIQGNSDVVICKLCNSYVVQAMIEVHNR